MSRPEHTAQINQVLSTNTLRSRRSPPFGHTRLYSEIAVDAILITDRYDYVRARRATPSCILIASLCSHSSTV